MVIQNWSDGIINRITPNIFQLKVSEVLSPFLLTERRNFEKERRRSKKENVILNITAVYLRISEATVLDPVIARSMKWVGRRWHHNFQNNGNSTFKRWTKFEPEGALYQFLSCASHGMRSQNFMSLSVVPIYKWSLECQKY